MSTLVVYASRHGSTKQIAEQIARQLRLAGVKEVKCLPTDEAEAQLPEAKSVIVGSPVYANRWHPDGAVFVEANRQELEDKKLFLFSSGGSPDLEPTIEAGLADYAPEEQVYFQGKLSKASLNPIEKAMIYFAKGQYGDYRDWTKINTWADQLARKVV
ncbi:flavodoxin domain-containing protein [Micrococcoides hystricis]|uniref:Flavodoxin domain-containing protein n=1 Tax=Micrococcoides hystricis TaxID=1572761 RepID=A0ABV6PCU5_9MICC